MPVSQQLNDDELRAAICDEERIDSGTYSGLIGYARALTTRGGASVMLREMDVFDHREQELVHRFFSKEGFRNRILQICTAATSGTSFRRLFTKAFENALVDAHRKTGKGRLFKRLRRLLAGSTDFRQVEGGTNAQRWTYGTVDPSSEWDGNLRRVTRATESVTQLQIVTWDSTERRAPVATGEDLLALSRACIAAAAAPLPLAVLTNAIADRLGVGAAPVRFDDGFDQPPSGAELADIDDESAAAEILDQLTPQERLILTNFEMPARELGPLIGCGKTQANVKRASLFELLEGLADDLNPNVAACLLQLAGESGQ